MLGAVLEQDDGSREPARHPDDARVLRALRGGHHEPRVVRVVGQVPGVERLDPDPQALAHDRERVPAAVDPVLVVAELHHDAGRRDVLRGQGGEVAQALRVAESPVRTPQRGTCEVEGPGVARGLVHADDPGGDVGVVRVDPVVDRLVADEAQRVHAGVLRHRRGAGREGARVEQLVVLGPHRQARESRRGRERHLVHRGDRDLEARVDRHAEEGHGLPGEARMRRVGELGRRPVADGEELRPAAQRRRAGRGPLLEPHDELRVHEALRVQDRDLFRLSVGGRARIELQREGRLGRRRSREGGLGEGDDGEEGEESHPGEARSAR